MASIPGQFYGLKSTVRVGGFCIDATEVKGRAQALLDTIQLVNQTLATVETLRKNCDIQISDVDRNWIDASVIPNARMALDRVAKLVESARVDMSARQGQLSWKARTVFALKDGPRVVESMTILNTASTALMTAITLLRTNHAPGIVIEQKSQEQKSPTDHYSPQSVRRKPSGPASSRASSSKGYEEAKFLKWRRQASSDPRLREGSMVGGASNSSGIQARPPNSQTPELGPGFDVFTRDKRPVYTGNDSFILLGEFWEPPAPGPPDITVTSPTTIDESDLMLKKEVHCQISPCSSNEGLCSNAPTGLASQSAQWLTGVMRYTSDGATHTYPQRRRNFDHHRSTSVISLPEGLEESRGRRFMKRQAGRPEI